MISKVNHTVFFTCSNHKLIADWKDARINIFYNHGLKSVLTEGDIVIEARRQLQAKRLMRLSIRKYYNKVMTMTRTNNLLN